jgi:hypothetical protein
MPLTLQEAYRLNMFENRMQRRILGPKREVVTGGWRKLHDANFLICTLYQVSLVLSDKGGSDWQGMWLAWGDKYFLFRNAIRNSVTLLTFSIVSI